MSELGMTGAVEGQHGDDSRPGTVATPLKPRWSWLLVHPVFWLSVVVLLLNDRVLKWSHPGLVTGKLSDVAGVVMVAVVFVALTGRIRVSLGLTAVLFALLKTVPQAAVWAEPVLGGRTLTDPTDLVALLALIPLGWWLWRHTVPHGRRRSRGVGVWATAAKIAGVGVAVFATTATSCVGRTPFWSLGVAPDGAIVQEGGVGRSRLILPVESTEQTSDGDYLAWEWNPDDDDVDLAGSQDRVCLDDGTCVAIRGLSIVEIDPEGGERVVVDYSDQRAAINDYAIDCQADELLWFPDVVTSRGVVVVAMGPVGAMVRTRSGEWLPTGYERAVPSVVGKAVRQQRIVFTAWGLPVVAAIAGVVAVAFTRESAARRASRIIFAVVLALSTLVVLQTAINIFEVRPGSALLISLVGSLLALAVCVWPLLRQRRRTVQSSPSG